MSKMERSDRPMDDVVGRHVDQDLAGLSGNYFGSSPGIKRSYDPNSDIDIYNAVAGSASFQDRARTGTSADLEDVGSGQIRKVDKPGEANLIDLEAQMYMQLEDLGFRHMPIAYELDTDHIDIERLDYGTSLYDYAEAAAKGLISEEKWVEICERCAHVVEAFHELGMVHGDLHPGNLVIVLDKEAGFQPYLIDFSFSTHVEDLDEKLEILADRCVRFAEDHDYSQEGDIERLTKSLEQMYPNVDEGFLKGVRALGG